MAISAARARAVDRIARLCDTGQDALALRLILLEEIRRVVAFDAHAWLLTDPETEVGSAPLADVPCLDELPSLIRLKYLTPVNRWTQLNGPVSLLSAATGGHPERSLVWREMLAAIGVGDIASMVFRCRLGCWSFLDLWRIGETGSFTKAEGEFLSAIAPSVTTALRRCQALAFTPVAPSPAGGGPVVLVLSPALEVKAQTPATNQYLRLLVPTESDRRPIPSGAYNVAAQLLAIESGVDDHPASARVHLAGGVWLTLRAARIGVAAPGEEQDIAVTIEAIAAADRMALFARACGLSTRERELLAHLLTGTDTRQIAQRMFISEHTVQDHLKSIFTKTGAGNRRTLLARAAGDGRL